MIRRVNIVTVDVSGRDKQSRLAVEQRWLVRHYVIRLPGHDEIIATALTLAEARRYA